MIQYNKHHGVIVPLVTPFLPNGDVDDAAVRKIVSHCASNDIAVFVLGTTGEAASISTQKRRRIVDIAVQEAAHRVKVYAGIGDNCSEHSIEAANEYLRLGADAVVAHLPGYYLLRPQEMRAYFEMIAANIQGGLMLYNIPQTTHMSVPLDVVESLSHIPNIIGLKDSENLPGRPEETVRRFAGRSDFSIFMGASVLSAKALRLGYDGLVPSSGNLAPELWHELYVNARAGEWDSVDALQTRLNAIASVFQRDRTLGESLAALKVMMESRGLCGATVLPPLRALDNGARAIVERNLAELSAS